MSGARIPFTPSGFFVLRTPLLPFDAVLSLGDELEAGIQADPGHLEAALAADRARIRKRLEQWLSIPEVEEGLFVASPDLADRLPRWRSRRDDKKAREIELSLTKYFFRMAARPTPFGLFGGCSVGTVGEATRLLLAERASYRRHSRLDMDYLSALTDWIASDPKFRARLTYRANSSLYRVGDRLYYAEARLRGADRVYHLVALERADYLDATLARAEEGGNRLEGLALSLVENDPEVTLDEAQEFVAELVDNQVLVPDLTLRVTGPEAMSGLLDDLQAADPGGSTWQVLEQVREDLRRLDETGLGNPPDRYRAIADRLSALPVRVEMSRLFQVDMFKPVQAATLGSGVIEEIARGVDLLLRGSAEPPSEELARFVEEFNKRYEGREVPLLRVLDEESGIGFAKDEGASAEPAPLLRGIALGRPAKTQGVFEARHGRLLQKLLEAREKGARGIQLDDRDVDALAAHPLPALPDAFAVTATLVARSSDSVNAGEFEVVFASASGPSGGRPLGRFCHGDEALSELLRQHLHTEESFRPDAVLAEVIHLPQGRPGNVLSRPVLRPYEIPFLGRPAVGREHQIPLQDLVVSIRDGRVVLRSRRLGKEVIPRLTSAHNYGFKNLGAYRFLGVLQSQGVVQSLHWRWGPLEHADFLPRVCCGRLVLSLARWNLSRHEVQEFDAPSESERYVAARRLRDRRGLPRLVLLADGDNRLLVDLENALSVEVFADLVRRRPGAVLLEVLPGPEQLCVRGPEGAFTHEIIIPFVRTSPQPTSNRTALSVLPTERDAFPPGSEWLYVKLYSGPATADRLLRDAVFPVAREAVRSGAAARWFFIRYRDSDTHLRVRFQGPPERLVGEILPALRAAALPYLESEQLWRFQLDTYERETDRYGGPAGVAAAEEIFHADSDAVLELLGQVGGDEGADARWRLGLKGVDQLLGDFKLDLEARQRLLRNWREQLAAEFVQGKSCRIQLGNRFREERGAVLRILEGRLDAADTLAAALAVLDTRSQRLQPHIARLWIWRLEGSSPGPLGISLPTSPTCS